MTEVMEDDAVSKGRKNYDEWSKERIRHDCLDDAILGVMAEVGYCKKRDAQGLSYPFASESDLIAAIRPAMRRHSLTLRPKNVEELFSGDYQTKNGTLQRLCRLKVKFELSAVCLDRDDRVYTEHKEIEVAGEGTH